MIQTRQYLQDTFIRGATPSQQNFTDVFDTMALQIDMDAIIATASVINGEIFDINGQLEVLNVGVGIINGEIDIIDNNITDINNTLVGVNTELSDLEHFINPDVLSGVMTLSNGLIINDNTLPTTPGFVLTTDGTGLSRWLAPGSNNVATFNTTLLTVGNTKTNFYTWNFQGSVSTIFKQNYYGAFVGAGTSYSIYLDCWNGTATQSIFDSVTMSIIPASQSIWRMDCEFIASSSAGNPYRAFTTLYYNNSQTSWVSTINYAPGVTCSVVLSGLLLGLSNGNHVEALSGNVYTIN